MKKWKSLFLILAAVNVMILAGIFILISLPGGQKEPPRPTPSEYQLNVTSTKDSLAAFINTYLEKESSPDL
ncbi:DUF2140 family protein, partial [Bacillus licheniformis]